MAWPARVRKVAMRVGVGGVKSVFILHAAGATTTCDVLPAHWLFYVQHARCCFAGQRYAVREVKWLQQWSRRNNFKVLDSCMLRCAQYFRASAELRLRGHV